MELRLDARVVIERTHTNGDLRIVRPMTSKEARAANCAEGLDRTLAFAINADQFLTLKKRELFTPDARLRAHCRPGMLAAAGAMAMVGSNEGRSNFETNSTAKATASDNAFHEHLQSLIRQSCAAYEAMILS
jgi:hypothetical protein